ncbi:hypothetical protein HDU76_013887 [Blyttiomyces sp. JEL0837]|nr:hypothetical protein HDU76_013887 [Blyttiomyces sp. JEL0837]
MFSWIYSRLGAVKADVVSPTINADDGTTPDRNRHHHLEATDPWVLLSEEDLRSGPETPLHGGVDTLRETSLPESPHGLLSFHTHQSFPQQVSMNDETASDVETVCSVDQNNENTSTVPPLSPLSEVLWKSQTSCSATLNTVNQHIAGEDAFQVQTTTNNSISTAHTVPCKKNITRNYVLQSSSSLFSNLATTNASSTKHVTRNTSNATSATDGSHAISQHYRNLHVQNHPHSKRHIHPILAQMRYRELQALKMRKLDIRRTKVGAGPSGGAGGRALRWGGTVSGAVGTPGC